MDILTRVQGIKERHGQQVRGTGQGTGTEAAGKRQLGEGCAKEW
jgi:hypothetical protein